MSLLIISFHPPVVFPWEDFLVENLFFVNSAKKKIIYILNYKEQVLTERAGDDIMIDVKICFP